MTQEQFNQMLAVAIAGQLGGWTYMTQEQFNQMLAVAIAGQLGGGTYISKYSGEEIDAAVGAGAQGPIIKNGTWWTWSVDHYVDTGVSAAADLADGSVTWDNLAAQVQMNHGNLLLNWDFRRPVNRQGKVEYIGPGYAIDRWRMRSKIEVTIGGTGVHLSLDNTNALKAFSQPVENPKQYTGLTLTFSVLLANNTMTLESDPFAGWGAWLAATDATHTRGIGIVQPEGNGLFSVTFTVPEDFGGYEYLNVGLYAGRCTGSADVKACKLELGGKQTLAHQDESGNWVLNDPPNYDLQYLLTSLYSPTTGEWAGIQHSNPSLLDNGYFVGGGSQQRSGQFPINQRDQTEYTGAAGYCIDRWRRDAGLLVSLESDGLKLTRASEGNNALGQILDNPANLRGQTLTLSIVVKGTTGTSAGLGYNPGSGSTYGGYIPLTGDWQLISFVFSVPIDATSLSVIIRYATTNNFAAEEAVLAAAKLEIGPIQTLAHKDDDGNWVLNDPPPNYQQELAKCQNYYIPSHNGFYPLTVINGFGAICRIPGTMRAIPAVIDSGNRVYGTDGNWHTATPKSVELGPTFVIVKYDLGSSTWYTLGTTYMLQHAPALDANL